MIRYQELDTVPEQLIHCPPEDLHTLLGGPTLIHIAGNQEQPIFISTLLHGNEHTGILVIQKLLSDLQTKGQLARPITLLIGNTQAAAWNQRLLQDQEDYNRIWTAENASLSGHLVERVTQLVRERDYLICVDIHNNTGTNPLYSCIPMLDHDHLSFAGLFTRTCIYFTQPSSTQTIFLSQFAPAITLECGHSGEKPGLGKAIEFIDSILHLQSIPQRLPREVQVFHTVARLRIRPGIKFMIARDDESTDVQTLVLRADIDKLNFSLTARATFLGTWTGEHQLPIVIDSMQEGLDLSHHESIYLEHGQIYLKDGYYPAMFTRDERVIEQDCLGYLMKEV